jgi:hypothetical protein
MSIDPVQVSGISRAHCGANGTLFAAYLGERTNGGIRIGKRLPVWPAVPSVFGNRMVMHGTILRPYEDVMN